MQFPVTTYRSGALAIEVRAGESHSDAWALVTNRPGARPKPRRTSLRPVEAVPRLVAATLQESPRRAA